MPRAAALALAAVMLLTLAACGESTGAPPAAESSAKDAKDAMTHITLTVGGSAFPARLLDNDAARALLSRLPMTLAMSDLNGNEKYFYLAEDLPSPATESPAVINAGDIMCWSGNCLVLFYDTFANSYGGYVRLGYVEDASGLAEALGGGGVEIVIAQSGPDEEGG